MRLDFRNRGSLSLLVIFSGLPGTGKSTIARAVAAELGATYIRIDSIEQALKNSTLQIDPVDDAGYMAGFALAHDNLKLGRVVVADSVNPVEQTRTAWRDAARRAGVSYADVEITCSDRAEHRARVEARVGGADGLVQPKWADVEARAYVPWTEDRVVIDTAGREAAACTAELVARLRALTPL